MSFTAICISCSDPRYRSQGSLLAILRLVPGQPSQIQLHLPLVLRIETSLLEFHDHQTLQLAVVEEQVDVEVVPIELNASLPGIVLLIMANSCANHVAHFSVDALSAPRR